MDESVNRDTAIQLRQMRDFPPVRNSVFEDPADWKSALGTQHFSRLSNFYSDREPEWYASTIEELAGLGRVLDLGCGPGLALAAMRAQGVREAIGIDRWEGFREGVEAAGAKLVLHDLTLPMPFLRSASFDGIFSHFALEYISPIGVQQALREAARLLEPDGLLLIHLTAPGLALGDTARTTPYDEAALTRLLTRAGFEDFTVEQPEEREITIVHARGPGTAPEAGEPGGLLEHEAAGEIQVAAGLGRPEGGEPAVEIEVSDGEESVSWRPDLTEPAEEDDGGPIADVSVCARVVATQPGEYELQAWAWRGSRIAAIDTIELEIRPELIRLRASGGLEHRNTWVPEPPMLEPPGAAYATADEQSPSHEPGEEWRVRGRRVIVAREGDDRDVLHAATRSEDRFLVDRPASGARPEALDEDWDEGRVHGLVLRLDDALASESPLLSWAESRGALLYLEAFDWAAVEPVVGQLATSLSPVLIVDPALTTRETEPQAEVEAPPEAIVSALDAVPALHLVLAGATAERAPELCARYPNRVVLGGLGDSLEHPPDGRLIEESTENLRYLTERTILKRLL
jgi:SAM-dependent methyltransferase